MTRRAWLIFALLALIWAFVVTRLTVAQPNYTDAFYYFNAGERLATGQGLTDPYLWNYTVLPDDLPAPSHLFWMPLASIAAAAGMSVFGTTYAAAQVPFALMYAGIALVAFGLGWRMGGTLHHAWFAGLLMLVSGFYIRFWGATSTFAPYGLFGSLCLLSYGVGLDRERGGYGWFAAAGALAALGHLTRNDGLLLLVAGWVAILWLFAKIPLKRRLIALAVTTLAYLLVMSPWFVRNLNAAGAVFPVDSTTAIWLTEYNDLFNYPQDVTAARFFEGGVGLLLSSRWLAFTNNLGTFVFVQGMAGLMPLMLVGLWVRRRDAFLRPFWVYALGLHVAMTLLFPFPGYRGGLFHSAAALMPFWVALAGVGLDAAVEWIAKRRRHWNAPQAKWVFSVGTVLLVGLLSLSVVAGGAVQAETPLLYTELDVMLPPDARVMINDPAQLYYFADRGGVSLPNASADVIPEIAERYNIDYVVFEYGEVEEERLPVGVPLPLWDILDAPPDFLEAIELDYPNADLYRILRD